MRFVRGVTRGSGCAAIVVLAATASTAPASGSMPSTVTRSTLITYPGCPAGSVTMAVSVPRRPVPTRDSVHYAVTLRNLSPQTCGPPNAITTATSGPLLASTVLARCGELPVAISDGRGQQVYPPFLAILCPRFVAPRLEGNKAVTASLSWNQVEGGGRPARRTQRAPAGVYHVTVQGQPRATFTISPGRKPVRRQSTTDASAPRVVTRTGRVLFEGCTHIVATVSVPARPVAGKAVTYTVSLRNAGAARCGPPPSDVAPGQPGLSVGPCGILPAVVRNAAGVSIYPGPVVFSCPNESFIDIPAHASVTATGTWPGTQSIGPPPAHTGPPPLITAAPPGRYRMDVGQRPSTISVPFTLVAGSSAPPPTVP